MNALTMFVTQDPCGLCGAAEMADNVGVIHGRALSRLVDILSTPRDNLSRKVAFVPQQIKTLDRALAEGDLVSLAGRIKIGMVTKGIDGPQELADAVNRVAPQLKLNRQTTAKWLSGETKNIEPPRLIALAEALDLDPEWLAIERGEPQRKGRVTLEHKRLIELYSALPEKMRRAWMRSGDALLEDTGETSTAQPFKAPTRVKK